MINLSVSFDKKELKKFQRFCDQYAEQLKIFRKNINIKIAEKVLEKLKDYIGSDETTKTYMDSLEVVNLDEECAAIVSNQMKLSSKMLDSNVDILYFLADGQELSAYGQFLIQNSPFVVDFIKAAPEDVKVVARKVAPMERNAVMAQNLVIRDELITTREAYIGKLITITEVYMDVYFTMMRLEFGLPGYKPKPHWSKIKNEYKKIVDEVMQDELKKLFSDKKLTDESGEHNELSAAEARELKLFQKEVI